MHVHRGPIPYPAVDASKAKKGSGWLGAILGVWLSGIFAASLVGHLYSGGTESGGGVDMAVLLVAIIWPLFYFMFSRHSFIPAPLHRFTALSLVIFFVFSLSSVFFSAVMFMSTAYLVLAFMSIWICLQFVSALDVLQLERGMKFYAVLMTVMLVGFAAWDHVPGVRLGEGRRVLEPAALGMISLSTAMTAMAIRLKPLRYVLIGVLLYVIYLTGSRAPTLGTLLGLTIIGYERIRVTGIYTKLLMVTIGLGILAALSMHMETVSSLIDSFLGLHDKHRGIEAGGSGRVQIWEETWQLFLDNPVFGVGFRGHEARLVLGSSAHNGYLAMLAEVGIVGFSAIMFVILSGIWRLWRAMRRDVSLSYTHSILLGLSCAYLFLALFERFLLNSGNPTSILFLMSILMMAVRQPNKTPRQGLLQPDLSMTVR